MANANDPTSLTDEELDKLIAGEELEEVEEPETPEAPEEEEKPEPEAEEEEKPKPEEEETPEEEEEKPPSRRAQLRIQQLLEKYKPEAPKPAPKTGPVTGLDYEKELDADPEIIEKLTNDRKAAADNARNEAYSDMVKQQQSSEWRTMLHIDAPQVEGKYNILNPKDEEHFHPAVTRGITDWYLSMTGYDPEAKTVENPNIRWGEFVDGIMELADEIASTKVAAATKNITGQVAKTGIRPDGSTSKKMNLNQAPESMTDEELDAVIAQAIPKR